MPSNYAQIQGVCACMFLLHYNAINISNGIKNIHPETSVGKFHVTLSELMQNFFLLLFF